MTLSPTAAVVVTSCVSETAVAVSEIAVVVLLDSEEVSLEQVTSYHEYHNQQNQQQDNSHNDRNTQERSTAPAFCGWR